MRVIFCGITGTRQAELAEKLAKYAVQRSFGITEPVDDLEKDYIKDYIQVHKIEGKDNFEEDFSVFLSSYNDIWKREVWSEAVNKILKKMVPSPKNAFLLIHNYFLRNGRFFSCADWPALREFKPDVFVTLIDDIFDLWQRVEDREKEIETRSHFDLEELILWRSLETAGTAHLAQNLSDSPIPHYVMSVKHSVETFWHLIFNPEKRPIVYGCCPISKTRNHPQAREEIDNYHKELASNFIAINPLTIDELRTKSDNDWLQLLDDFSWFEDKRWPLTQEPPLGPPAVNPTPLTENPFQGLIQERLLKLKSKIEDEIVNRDFILVSQVKYLLAYRPFYPEIKDEKKIKSKDISGGMGEEIAFAQELKKPVVFFHPKYDYDSGQERFFQDRGSRAQITYFPPKEKLPDLPPDDFTGFPDLIDNIIRRYR